MSEIDPDMRRVVVEVRQNHLEELLGTLGSFASRHDIHIDVSAAPLFVSEESIELENPRYNPDMVSWITLSESEEPIAVVTGQHFKDFTAKEEQPPILGGRLANRLLSPHFNYQVREFLVTDTKGNTYVRADSIQRLHRALKDKTADIQQFGEACIDLLGEYCDQLFLKQE